MESSEGPLAVAYSASSTPNERFHVMPRALDQKMIDEIVRGYGEAAYRLQSAGIDGVEIVASHGYLPSQFLNPRVNVRDDEYGGSSENRLRFLKEVTEAVSGEIGPDRVGVRLAPLTTLNGTVDANPQETYLAAARLLGALDVAYLHIAEADWDDAPLMAEGFKQGLRDAFPNTLIYAGKYDGERARAALQAGWALLMPVIILGGIYGGIFTPTEAAVVASIPALPAASAVTSAGSVFFSPGIDTACSRVAWPAKGRM